MVLTGWPCRIAVTAALTLLLLPAPFYVPDLYPRHPPPPQPPLPLPPPPFSAAWRDAALAKAPPLEIFLTILMLSIGFLIYASEWVQRKLMERRIIKLNGYLVSSVSRLRAMDAQQEQVEATLRMVQHATSEYNLLLYLLLRHHAAPVCPSSNSPHTPHTPRTRDKDLRDLLQRPTLDT